MNHTSPAKTKTLPGRQRLQHRSTDNNNERGAQELGLPTTAKRGAQGSMQTTTADDHNDCADEDCRQPRARGRGPSLPDEDCRVPGRILNSSNSAKDNVAIADKYTNKFVTRHKGLNYYIWTSRPKFGSQARVTRYANLRSKPYSSRGIETQRIHDCHLVPKAGLQLSSLTWLQAGAIAI
ncbi:hypothetical protein BDZ89DRAFT_1117763 [Hymenopellis radicata]|nr:hypothetical protein BDZ89DRAFT_1117763 [Hymenopellis radicata]